MNNKVDLLNNINNDAPFGPARDIPVGRLGQDRDGDVILRLSENIVFWSVENRCYDIEVCAQMYRLLPPGNSITLIT